MHRVDCSSHLLHRFANRTGCVVHAEVDSAAPGCLPLTSHIQSAILNSKILLVPNIQVPKTPGRQYRRLELALLPPPIVHNSGEASCHKDSSVYTAIYSRMYHVTISANANCGMLIQKLAQNLHASACYIIVGANQLHNLNHTG